MRATAIFLLSLLLCFRPWAYPFFEQSYERHDLRFQLDVFWKRDAFGLPIPHSCHRANESVARILQALGAQEIEVSCRKRPVDQAHPLHPLAREILGHLGARHPGGGDLFSLYAQKHSTLVDMEVRFTAVTLTSSNQGLAPREIRFEEVFLRATHECFLLRDIFRRLHGFFFWWEYELSSCRWDNEPFAIRAEVFRPDP